MEENVNSGGGGTSSGPSEEAKDLQPERFVGRNWRGQVGYGSLLPRTEFVSVKLSPDYLGATCYS